jgi:CheY-like chemotaxis protein
MFLSWWRIRAKRAKTRHLLFQRCRLVFERLEDRCLLSAKPAAVQAAYPLLSEPSGTELQAISVLATSGSVGVHPAPLEANAPSSILSVGSGSLPIAARKGTVAAGAEMSPSTLLVNTAQRSPDEPNASVPQPKRQPVLGNQNGSFLQNIGLDLPGNGLSPEDNVGALANGANLQSGGPSLGIGDLFTSSPDSGLNNIFTGQGDLLLNQDGAANNVVASDGGGLLLGGGVFLGRSASSSGSTLHLAGGSITATPVTLGNLLSNAGNQVAVNKAGQIAVQGGFDNQVQTSPAWESSNPAGMHWLSADWTASAPEVRVGEAVGYPQAGFSQNVSLTIPSSSLAAQRQVSVGFGMSADHGPQVAGYLVGGTSYSQVLGGRDNEWIEKLGSSTGIFAKASPAAETLDSGGAAANESSPRDPILGTSLTVLGGEGATWETGATRVLERAPHLTAGPVNPPPVRPSSGEGFQSLQMVDSVSHMGLFQLDVARGAPVPSDTSLGNTSTSTAADLRTEQSSIWSIVTTYSLVILPRQRRPQPTILVVDPDDATRDAVNVALVREGYFVLPAASVRDAWGMLRTPHARIDLVLMDPHLPDVSGIHLCARLREMSPTVPVMVCAGEVEPAEADQLRQLGVRYYLRKPIAFEELLHTVRAILA